MVKNKKHNRQKQAQSSDSRPTIGYFAPLARFAQLVWSGIVDAARKRDVNLICFDGSLDNPNFWMQPHIIYDLATIENVAGAVSWASMMGNYFTIDELEAFHERYRPLPVVTMGKTLEQFPGVLMDSYDGMRAAVSHLIETHGYRRMAFVRGPEDNVYAQGRYQAYVETLEAYDLPFDPNLVAPPASWTYSEGHATGMEAMRLLLDERGLRPQTDLEAVVGASEIILLGAMEELQTRGIKIPGEVALAGFDDTILGQTSIPPLTSVAPPFYETGYQAVETLLTLMEGDQVPHETIVPSKLVVRQSCGCLLPAVAQVMASPVEVSGETFEAALAARQAKILSEMRRQVGDSAEHMARDWAERLLQSFAAELQDESSGIFLRELDEMLSQGITGDGDVSVWQEAVSALRRQALPYLNGEMLLHAKDVWEQARVTIGEAAQRQQAYQGMLAREQAQTLREIGAALITMFDLAGLTNALAERLPELGISSCYLALYENPQPYQYPQPAPEWSRLMLAYTEKGRVELEPDGRRFRSHDLLPEGLWPEGRQFSFVVGPLYFQKNQLGFALFEIGPREATIYQALRGEISSALQGASLVQQEKKRTHQLQTVAEVSTATSTILDTVDLLQRVVDLTKARFSLYHTHIYLLNEAGDALVLAAGTGKVGQQMVTEGWNIPLNQEQSIVARVARTRRGDIVNNVQADPQWLPNPLLPDTRSELAVPLIIGDQVLGVLDIQADEIDYFTQDDIRIQSTLAAQVAVAIQNARLYRQEAERGQELAKVNADLKAAQDELI
ncbi:substrate-binding domain-containing protein, partial [Chloroflexota bacterium]